MSKLSNYCAALAAVMLLSVPALATAAVELDATELRSYELPEGFNFAGAQKQTAPNGDTVLSVTTGDEEYSCTIVRIGDDGATAFSYQYQGGTTACTGVLPHPDGGFFVRGLRADAQQGDISGFTARISADGSEMWSTDDALLVKEDGSGEFFANYAGAHPEMAYSPDNDYLLGFTVGTITIGDSTQQVAEGHVLKGESGTVRVTGWTFQGTGSPGFVAETVARSSDGYFLLYIYNAGSRGAHFFTFNGRTDNSKFEPLGEDWSERFVRQMVYGPDDNVHLMWTPGDSSDSPTVITVVDEEAGEDFHAPEVWSTTFEPTVEVDFADEPIEMGLPYGMWVGADYTLVLYQAADQLVLRVVDIATGEEVGVAPLEGLTEFAPQAILNGEGGRLKLLAVDEETGNIHEFRLEITDLRDDETGGDAGIGDAGDGSGGSSSGGGDDGCAAGAPTRPAPLGAALLAIGMVVFTIARRFDLQVSDLERS